MTENDITKVYLQDLDKQHPISKEEEKLVGREIEKNKKRLLEECTRYEFFWNHILLFKRSHRKK